MKLFIAFVAFVAVAAAMPFKPISHADEELEAIIAAIQHPSTDPATAALLEQQLQEIISAVLPPIVSEPIIVEEDSIHPIAVPEKPVPSPIVVPSPTPSSSALVQIVVNVRNAADVGAGAIVPTPILIEDEAQDNNPVEATPIQIVDSVAVPAEPILIAEPIVPLPVINIPLPVNNIPGQLN